MKFEKKVVFEIEKSMETIIPEGFSGTMKIGFHEGKILSINVAGRIIISDTKEA